MAGKHKRKQSSRDFLRRLPTLKTRDIDRYIRENRGKITQRVFDAIKGREQALKHSSESNIRTRQAVKRFRPRKDDRGKIVLINTEGKRNPKRKALAVYVTKSGKKWRLTKKTERVRDISFSQSRFLSRSKQQFERSKLVQVGERKSITRRSDSIRAGGAHDFRGEIVGKIARSLKKVFDGQAGNRSFLIEVAVLLKHSDGTTSTTTFSLPIDRQDNIAVKLAGLRNFVERKFYAYMARALAYMGFITSGSANHIKRVTGESRVTEEIWTEYHSEAGHNLDWTAPRFEVVNIQKLEWRIKQAK